MLLSLLTSHLSQHLLTVDIPLDIVVSEIRVVFQLLLGMAVRAQREAILDVPRYTPGFGLLVERLAHYRSMGLRCVSRSVLGDDLATRDSMVYQRVGVTRFRQYVEMAEQRDIVFLGGIGDNAWVALRLAFYYDAEFS